MRFSSVSRLITTGLLMLFSLHPAAGQDSEPSRPVNVKSRTFGGTQFWTDVVVYRDWRIQQHALTKHHRLLDDKDTRRAWGSWEACRSELNRMKQDTQLPPVTGKVVIVLHGIVGFRSLMEDLCDYLDEHSHYEVINIGYASTRADLASHASALKSVIDHLPEATEINFVAHSMGNLVIRRYLADSTDAENGKRPDRRIKRIVMVGPPNNGARMAEIFKDVGLFKFLLGKSGEAMAAPADLERQLAVPQCEFAIIAGGRGNDRGYSPLLKGDDDLVVSVSETRLPGARDFMVVPSIHRFLPDQPEVHACALQFLRHGYFVSEERRQPIIAEDKAAEGDR